MAQQMVNYFNRYNQRIQFLRAQGDQVMQQILSMEIGMNRRKQQKQQPHNDDIVNMQSMVVNVLKMLAEIKTCEYFKTTHQLHNPDDYYYKQMCYRYFKYLLLHFNVKLKAKHTDQNQYVDFLISM